MRGFIMKQMSRIFLLLSIIALMVGCKLAVIVVEGGEVESIGSGICVAGSICIVDVTDPNFSETFKAVPHTGWYFKKWNSGYRFFCGGSTSPNCYLSFHGYEESDEVVNMAAASEVFYLMPVFTKDPGATKVEGALRTIEVDGEDRLWLQPADFTDYSYNQVSAVCPNAVCSGSLPGSGIDLTGYKWSSSDDIRLLLNAYAEAGISIFAEFEPTGRELDFLALHVLLSDPPYVKQTSPQYSEATTYVAFLGGDETDSSVGFDIMQYGDVDSAGVFGAWFWRPIP